MKKKILSIIKDIKSAVETVHNRKFWIEWFGAYDIDPKNLAICVCVNTDAEKNSLAQNKELAALIRNSFINHDYPVEAIPLVVIGFESEETVKRESNGDWYMHFK